MPARWARKILGAAFVGLGYPISGVDADGVCSGPVLRVGFAEEAAFAGVFAVRFDVVDAPAGAFCGVVFLMDTMCYVFLCEPVLRDESGGTSGLGGERSHGRHC